MNRLRRRSTLMMLTVVGLLSVSAIGLLLSMRDKVATIPAGHLRDVDLGENVSLKLAYVPPGRFLMGSPAEELRDLHDPRFALWEKQHRVTLTEGYYIGVTEVTQAQWERVMGNNPSRHRGSDLPVTRVSWNDAVEFCNKLSAQVGLTPVYRFTFLHRLDDNMISHAWVERVEGANGFQLPTEAQWEYACRAGTSSPYNLGDTISTDQANYNGNWKWNMDAGSTRVGQGGVNRGKVISVGSLNNPNSWGLFDMHGNVEEWCSDWIEPYGTSHVTDPMGPAKGRFRVVRGGSWDSEPFTCRSGWRNSYPVNAREKYIGFRVAVPATTLTDSSDLH